jgi:hypothetical protein
MRMGEVKTQIQVPRWMFMLWTDGVFLDRHGTSVRLVNTNLTESAKAAMDAGETIYFTDGRDNIISRMVKESDGYHEYLIEGE